MHQTVRFFLLRVELSASSVLWRLRVCRYMLTVSDLFSQVGRNIETCSTFPNGRDVACNVSTLSMNG